MCISSVDTPKMGVFGNLGYPFPSLVSPWNMTKHDEFGMILGHPAVWGGPKWTWAGDPSKGDQWPSLGSPWWDMENMDPSLDDWPLVVQRSLFFNWEMTWSKSWRGIWISWHDRCINVCGIVVISLLNFAMTWRTLYWFSCQLPFPSIFFFPNLCQWKLCNSEMSKTSTADNSQLCSACPTLH